MQAGKALMAQSGYEQTPTAAIAREAGSSESQLMRYFGGKAGLLKAIVDESWVPLNLEIQAVIAESADAPAALAGVLALFIQVFKRDADLARLFLFEGRRVRGPQHEIDVSDGYLEFIEIVHRLVGQAQNAGNFSRVYDSRVMVAAMVGAAEAMVREGLMARAAEGGSDFSAVRIRLVFEGMLAGFATGS